MINAVLVLTIYTEVKPFRLYNTGRGVGNQPVFFGTKTRHQYEPHAAGKHPFNIITEEIYND